MEESERGTKDRDRSNDCPPHSLSGPAGDQGDADRGHHRGHDESPEPEEQVEATGYAIPNRSGPIEKAKHHEDRKDDEKSSPNIVGLAT
jgi:hypothetical protein